MGVQVRLFASVILLVATRQIDLGNAVPTPNTKFYYYSYGRTTWNAANEWCRSQGLTMLKVASADVLTAIQELRKPIWGFQRGGFWLGLHDTDESPNKETYMWADCTALGSYRPWRNQSQIDDGRCVRGSLYFRIDSNWKRKDCSKAYEHVICQETTGECSFDLRTDLLVDSSTHHVQVVAGSERECLQKCREYDSPECWGIEMGVQDCVLYFADSYTEFISKLTKASPISPSSAQGTDIMVKVCFEGVLDTVARIPTVFNNAEDRAPHTGCRPDLVPETTALIETTTEVPDETSTMETTTTTAVGTTTTPRSETTSVGQTTERTALSSLQATTDDLSSTGTEPTTAGETAPVTLTTTTETSTVEATTTTQGLEMTSAGQEEVSTTLSSPKTTPDDHSTYDSENTSPGETVPVNEATENTTTATARMCKCPCRKQPNMTEAEKREFIQNILANLTLNRTEVSARKRKYVSVSDDRLVAKAIGTLGIVILSVAFGGLIILDFAALKRDAIGLYRNISGWRQQ